MPRRRRKQRREPPEAYLEGSLAPNGYGRAAPGPIAFSCSTATAQVGLPGKFKHAGSDSAGGRWDRDKEIKLHDVALEPVPAEAPGGLEAEVSSGRRELRDLSDLPVVHREGQDPEERHLLQLRGQASHGALGSWASAASSSSCGSFGGDRPRSACFVNQGSNHAGVMFGPHPLAGAGGCESPAVHDSPTRVLTRDDTCEPSAVSQAGGGKAALAFGTCTGSLVAVWVAGLER